MKLYVGLGNPGEQYSNTRHNIGFILLDKLNLSFSSNSKFEGLIAKEGNSLYLKPQTFMNKSGKSVSKAMSYYDIDPIELFVIHDDLDLPLGVIRKSFDSGSGGHNGVQSIVDQLGTKAFNRIRVGIGRPERKEMVESYVLLPFGEGELDQIMSAIKVEEFR